MRTPDRIACILAGVMSVVFAAVRLLFSARRFPFGGMPLWVLCLVGASLAALLAVCARRRRAVVSVSGVPLRLLCIAAAFAGVSLLVNALIGGFNWLSTGTLPYPQPVVVVGYHRLVALVLFVSALLSGVFFLSLAAGWLSHRRTGHEKPGILSLAPVVWIWARLLWYITSFVSAVHRFDSLYEVGSLLFEMLFLLSFARLVSHIEAPSPGFAIGLSLCAGFLGFSGYVVRLGFSLMEGAAFSVPALLIVPDFAIALLCFAFAVGQVWHGRDTRPPADSSVIESSPADPPPAPASDSSVEELTGASESPLPPSSPVELEDLINDIRQGFR